MTAVIMRFDIDGPHVSLDGRDFIIQKKLCRRIKEVQLYLIGPFLKENVNYFYRCPLQYHTPYKKVYLPFRV